MQGAPFTTLQVFSHVRPWKKRSMWGKETNDGWNEQNLCLRGSFDYVKGSFHHNMSRFTTIWVVSQHSDGE